MRKQHDNIKFSSQISRESQWSKRNRGKRKIPCSDWLPFEIYPSQRTAHRFQFHCSHFYSKEIRRSPPIFAPDFLIICVIAVNNMFPKAKRFQDTGKTGKYKNRAGLLHYHVSVSTTYGRQLWNWLEKM